MFFSSHGTPIAPTHNMKNQIRKQYACVYQFFSHRKDIKLFNSVAFCQDYHISWITSQDSKNVLMYSDVVCFVTAEYLSLTIGKPRPGFNGANTMFIYLHGRFDSLNQEACPHAITQSPTKLRELTLWYSRLRDSHSFLWSKFWERLEYLLLIIVNISTTWIYWTLCTVTNLCVHYHIWYSQHGN